MSSVSVHHLDITIARLVGKESMWMFVGEVTLLGNAKINEDRERFVQRLDALQVTCGKLLVCELVDGRWFILSHLPEAKCDETALFLTQIFAAKAEALLEFESLISQPLDQAA